MKLRPTGILEIRYRIITHAALQLVRIKIWIQDSVCGSRSRSENFYLLTLAECSLLCIIYNIVYSYLFAVQNVASIGRVA